MIGVVEHSIQNIARIWYIWTCWSNSQFKSSTIIDVNELVVFYFYFSLSFFISVSHSIPLSLSIFFVPLFISPHHPLLCYPCFPIFFNFGLGHCPKNLRWATLPLFLPEYAPALFLSVSLNLPVCGLFSLSSVTLILKRM